MTNLAMALKIYDKRMDDLNERTIARLRAHLNGTSANTDEIFDIVAAFRADIEAEANALRQDIRREAFTLIEGGKE